MKKQSAIFVLLLVLFLPDVVLAPYTLVIINGVITDEVSGELISDASVSTDRGSVVFSTSGLYDLRHIPGDWEIKVVASKYKTIVESIHVSVDEPFIRKDFSLTPIPLEELAKIKGNILDEITLEPIPDIEIFSEYSSSGSKTDGQYELYLEPGTWKIEALDWSYEDRYIPNYEPSFVELTVDKAGQVIELDIMMSSLSALITGTVTDKVSWMPIVGAIITTDGVGFTYSGMNGYYNLYEKPGTWNIEASADGYGSFYETIVVEGAGTIQKDIEMYPINVSITTTTIDPNATTTTTSCIEGDPCCIESTYGEHSEKTELLRYFRDNVLSPTPAGQEIIRLYYEWNPAIVKAMEEDEAFKEEVKEMVDGVLELMEE